MMAITDRLRLTGAVTRMPPRHRATGAAVNIAMTLLIIGAAIGAAYGLGALCELLFDLILEIV